MIEHRIHPPDEWLAQRLASTAEKLGQRRAQQLMREMRREASKRAQQRKEELRIKVELGGEVVKAGLRSWSQDEVLGLLLDGRDRVSSSPTLRLAMRKKGEAFRAKKSDPAFAPCAPPTIH